MKTMSRLIMGTMIINLENACACVFQPWARFAVRQGYA